MLEFDLLNQFDYLRFRNKNLNAWFRLWSHPWLTDQSRLWSSSPLICLIPLSSQVIKSLLVTWYCSGPHLKLNTSHSSQTRLWRHLTSRLDHHLEQQKNSSSTLDSCDENYTPRALSSREGMRGNILLILNIFRYGTNDPVI